MAYMSSHNLEMPGYARSSCSAVFSAFSALQSEHVRRLAPHSQSAVSLASHNSRALKVARFLRDWVAIGVETNPIK
jgi:hypothetical protein